MIERSLGVDEQLLTNLLHEPWRFYRRRSIPKSDGDHRRLLIPKGELKGIQRGILQVDLAKLPKHDCDHCRAGRSVLTNARTHLRHRYVSAYDIEHCFPSVTPRMVEAALRRAGFSTERAHLITALTTHKRQLPQGAPTSPALVSAVLYSMDERLAQWAMRHGLTYTRYADDVFVSGNKPLGAFRMELLRATAALGLRLAHDKTRHWTPQRRAELAGVVLAAKPTIRAEYVDSVGRLIHRLEHRRVLVSPPDIESLWGKIGWIEALRPVAGRKLRERLRRALKSPCAVGPTLSMELANQSGAA